MPCVASTPTLPVLPEKKPKPLIDTRILFKNTVR